MIGPEPFLVAIATIGGFYMFVEDIARFEINPWAASATGVAAIMLAGSFGPYPLASSALAACLMGGVVSGLRFVSPSLMGRGDYWLFAACGALVGFEAILVFGILIGIFALAIEAARLGLRASGHLPPLEGAAPLPLPAAAVAMPAALIGAIARYGHGATFSDPIGWLP